MKRKKVNSLLKGVAGFGVALGGATVFTDADVVYANDAEGVLAQSEQEGDAVETLESQSQQTQEEVSSTSEANSTSAAKSDAEVNATSEANKETASNSASEADAKSEASSTEG